MQRSKAVDLRRRLFFVCSIHKLISNFARVPLRIRLAGPFRWQWQRAEVQPTRGEIGAIHPPLVRSKLAFP